MSDVFYPVSLIEMLHEERFTRAVQDEFEDGTTASRLLWATRTFKRRFTVKHAPLTQEEFAVLRGFYLQQNGGHEPFWFRDNVNRGGNASVRFATPLPSSREKLMQMIELALVEVAPIAANPELYEMTSAAGTRPLIWWDANRVRYYQHPVSGAQTEFLEEGIYDASERGNTGVWQSGGTSQAPGGILGQTQYFGLNTQQWAKLSSNLGITSAQPALTMMCFVRCNSVATPSFIWTFSGAAGAVQGIAMARPAGTHLFRMLPTPLASQSTNNVPADTWTGIALTFPNGADTAKWYINGSLVASGACSPRNAQTGFSLGADLDGTDRTENGADLRVAHALAFNAELSDAQVKAVHNLLCRQFGLPLVA